ncbi:MAG: hypothetical protein KAT30_11160, partial [Candidatus Krumholzibacteria bacterium]|nr:hypothetical protein [Candidatus Krumholzibacteria bacterium]
MAKAQVNECAACGRRARRICPALAGMICPACCGIGRGTKIECPPDCSYFPFGTAAYDLWLKIDEAWQPKALKYVVGKIGQAEFKAAAKQLAPSWLDKDHAFIEGAGAALLYYLAVNKGDDLPLGEIWKEEGWPGLNNDERFMAEYRTHSLPGVLEVQRVLNDTAVECIDLLDPDRGNFVVFDRGTASTASRFATMIVWLTHYPHFTRLAGNGVIVPNELSKKFLSAIRERAEETFNSDSDEAVKRYLAESFGEAADLVKSLIDERRDQMIASLDADQCAASYQLRVPREDIENVLNEKPDFETDDNWDREPGDPPDTGCYVWLRRGEAKRIEEEIPGLSWHDEEDDSAVGGLGLVKLTNDDLRFTTMGRQKFAFAKKLVASYFQDKLELVNEEITPIETLMDNAE